MAREIGGDWGFGKALSGAAATADVARQGFVYQLQE